MRTVTFQSVIEGAARRAGLSFSLLSSANQQNLLGFVNDWTKKGWEWEFWPEWTPIEQRAYRDAYDAAKAYPAPTATTPQEVWDPASQRYYQALQATTGHAPAVVSNGVWVANAPYWADSVMGYRYGVPYGLAVPAPFYGSDWAPNTDYTAGPQQIVRNPSDDRYYQCIVTHTSGSTFDATKWGLLTVFERYVALDQTGQTPIGEVRGVYRNNPRTSPRFPGPLTFLINDKGILPAPMAGVMVWVEFRRRPPVFTLDAYVGATAYAKDALVYRSTTGECYQSLQAANSGHTPESSPTWWQKVDFPDRLAEFVKWAAYGDYLRSSGKTREAAAAEATAYELLSQASDVALASQAQYDRAQVQTY